MWSLLFAGLIVTILLFGAFVCLDNQHLTTHSARTWDDSTRSPWIARVETVDVSDPGVKAVDTHADTHMEKFIADKTTDSNSNLKNPGSLNFNTAMNVPNVGIGEELNNGQRHRTIQYLSQASSEHWLLRSLANKVQSPPFTNVREPLKTPPANADFRNWKAYYEPDLSEKSFNATVLIVSPLRNARNHLNHFIDLLLSINYPHSLVSLAFGEDSSSDGTYDYLLSHLTNFSDFRRVAMYQLHKAFHQGTDWASVHVEEHQLERRAHLAEARNKLLELTLHDEQYVLWVDSDVGSWRPDIVQHLLDAGEDIVAPACMYWTDAGHADVYDRNTWRETDESIARQRRLGKGELMLEGYGQPPRLYLPDLRGEQRRLVKIDGVGGCVLLINAALHRHGLSFPTLVFDHHIETEGLAKMAKSMGYQPYGMPFLEVYHL